MIEKFKVFARWVRDDVRAGAAWLWKHRTKTLGTAAFAVGYAREHFDQIAALFTPTVGGRILMGFGALAFLIGLFNLSAAAADPPP